MSFVRSSSASAFFFFNDTATTEIYTLSLHDALPISARGGITNAAPTGDRRIGRFARSAYSSAGELGRLYGNRHRSEEHTSELQSPYDLVCRLLLEKKKKKPYIENTCLRSTREDV